MKWGIVILLILGVVAAGSAAVLMGVLSLGSSGSANAQSTDIEVAMARTSLPAMTVITLNHIINEKIARTDLPQQGQLVTPARVIGRVLTMPVMEGQVLTDSCFVAEGDGSKLAAAIPYGMRAFTISVSSKSMPDPILLYPGCVVDVLVAWKLSGRASEGQAGSSTMFRGIQVIAVGGESVISNPNVEEKGTAKKRSTSRGTEVTLLVDTKQAEALQLAIQNGNLSLSVRNPLDKEIFEKEGTVLSQDRLFDLGSSLTPTVETAVPNEQSTLSEQPMTNNPQDQAQTGVFYDPNIPIKQPKSVETYQVPPSSRWGVTVIRGSQTKVEEFEASESEADGAAAKK